MKFKVTKESPVREANRDIMRGVKMIDILNYLVEKQGWEWLGERINILCFKVRPTIKSSRKFLRNTPWALNRLEELYVEEKLADQSKEADKA